MAKRHIRHIIVNGKFQYNMAATFAGLSALIMTVIIIILSAVLISSNTRLDEISRNQQVLSGTQAEIFKTLIVLSQSKNLANMRISADRLKHDNDETKRLLDQNNEKVRAITQRNRSIIVMLIISAAVQSAIIFYIMLRRSNRISGPLFLLNRYIDEMKSGRFPEIRKLRSHDDFQDVFDNFRDLAEQMKMMSESKVVK
ncbi:MAG TPA: hypothetical protein PK986_05815 [Spirochaetota bacterium]|nr:hypothetical protein [Spirochaetota bacterium]HQO39965.1 hypothetical protein [Spirochaetota bacterium]